MKNKSKMRVWSASLAALLIGALTGCAGQTTADSAIINDVQSSQIDSSPSSVISEVPDDYTADDTDAGWSEADAGAVITLNGSSADITGSGASAEGPVITISAGGLYVVSGTLTDGQILVNAPAADTVRIVLNGAEITGGTNAGIYAAQADKVILTLADGTENSVTDAAEYTYADTEAEEPDAAIFSKADLVLNGGGSLTVNGNFKNGIGTKDDLTVVSGHYTVSAVNDALRGRDSVTVLDGTLALTAGADGIQSNNGEDAEKGWVRIENGEFTISSGNDGIQAETALAITNGTFQITAGGGSTAASASSEDSMKGLKAGTSLTIGDGSFTIDSADDSVHSNGDIGISGGGFTISSGDDGVHADTNLDISGGGITIVSCVEGLEAPVITISGGEITINASDDGINASASDVITDGLSITINGGTVTISMGAGDTDAIDSNGDLTINDGILDITAQSPFDFDGTGALNGGTVTVNGQQVTELTNQMMGGGMGGAPGGMGGFPGDMEMPPDGGPDQGAWQP